VRLVTWNVLWRFEPDWRAREGAILTTLERLAPDVIALQECWGTADHSQAHLMAERLGMRHAAFLGPSLPPAPEPPELPDHAGVLMGVGLVSRWPIQSVQRHELPVSHRQVAPVALAARIDFSEAEFDVVVAATEWEPDFADDHLAQTGRLAELLAAGGSSHAGVPRFLLADLNCDRTQEEFAPLAAVADDTWELGGGDPDAVTLSSAVPFAPLEATKEIDRRIDHIFVNRESGVAVESAFTVDAPVGDLFPSDHFPVVADVQLRHGSAVADH
jgi:endonuclease/exonuclease/phosphatase family metal-dependent hydrolase